MHINLSNTRLMNKPTLTFQIIWTLSLMFTSGVALAQVAADTALYQASLNSALNKVVKSQQQINIGSEYKETYYFLRNGHPYFNSHLALTGDVVYNDVAYKDQQLQYELLRDELIAEHVTGKKIVLVKSKVSSFTLEQDTFIRLDIPSQNLEGFYHVLADRGDVKLVAKYSKKLTGKMYQDKPFIEQRSKYFLIRDNTAHAVRNYKNVMALLATKDQHLSLRGKHNSREAEMIDIVRQYSPTR
jgi:hypothetical protein